MGEALIPSEENPAEQGLSPDVLSFMQWSVERGDGLPDVVADEDRTIQVLTNLLANALR